MKGVVAAVVLGTVLGAWAQSPYLWGAVTTPQEAWQALPERAQALGIPSARFSPALGALVFTEVQSEEELLSQNVFLYVDGEVFLLGVREGAWTTIVRGRAVNAELVIYGPGTPGNLSSMALLEALGLVPPGGLVELVQKSVPAKLPAPPKGVKLDPVLWTLVGHPDWFGFAQAQGLARVGLRVRVVAELLSPLSAEWEPFIRSSTPTLAELLVPIPLLPVLGQELAVRIVRPPHIPVPLGG